MFTIYIEDLLIEKRADLGYYFTGDLVMELRWVVRSDLFMFDPDPLKLAFWQSPGYIQAEGVAQKKHGTSIFRPPSHSPGAGVYQCWRRHRRRISERTPEFRSKR